MYIVRELCWVLQIQGIDTYILVPTDPSGYQLLLGALRPQPAPGGVDVVIGTRGPIATPAMCNGIIVPLLFFDQIYSSDRSTLVKSVPTPAGADPNTFETSANTTYDQLMAQSGTGDTDASKALAYLALRYPQIYASACTAIASNSSLTSVSVLPSNLSATRRIVDVVFAFTNRNTDVVSKQFVRVDVQESTHSWSRRWLALFQSVTERWVWPWRRQDLARKLHWLERFRRTPRA